MEPERVAACWTTAFAATAVAGAVTCDAAAGGTAVSGAGAASPESAGVTAGASAPPSDPEPEAGAGSDEDGADGSVVAVESVGDPSVEAACALAAVYSSDERTRSPAASENAAPATNRAANVMATT